MEFLGPQWVFRLQELAAPERQYRATSPSTSGLMWEYFHRLFRGAGEREHPPENGTVFLSWAKPAFLPRAAPVLTCRDMEMRRKAWLARTVSVSRSLTASITKSQERRSSPPKHWSLQYTTIHRWPPAISKDHGIGTSAPGRSSGAGRVLLPRRSRAVTCSGPSRAPRPPLSQGSESGGVACRPSCPRERRLEEPAGRAGEEACSGLQVLLTVRGEAGAWSGHCGSVTWPLHPAPCSPLTHKYAVTRPYGSGQGLNRREVFEYRQTMPEVNQVT